MNPPCVTAIPLQIKRSGDIREMEPKSTKKHQISRESYLNIAPRTITPNRLSPPKPMTIALSDALVLLQNRA